MQQTSGQLSLEICQTATCFVGECHVNHGLSPENEADLKIPVELFLTPDRTEKRQNGRRFKEAGEDMFTLTGQDRHGVMIHDFYNHNTRSDGNIGTLTRNCGGTGQCGSFGISEGFRIRRLTPKECFRLQGYPDEYFERARKVNSDSQLYRQIGNSVTINVIYEIAKRLE